MQLEKNDSPNSSKFVSTLLIYYMEFQPITTILFTVYIICILIREVQMTVYIKKKPPEAPHADADMCRPIHARLVCRLLLPSYNVII